MVEIAEVCKKQKHILLLNWGARGHFYFGLTFIPNGLTNNPNWGYIQIMK
jgi:hypothetical protein